MFNLKDKELESYILSELNKKPSSIYDPNGNSCRAVLDRRRDSYFKSLRWCSISLFGDFKLAVKEFGSDTTLGEIASMAACVVFFPFVPFIYEYFTVKRAVRDYRSFRN